MCASDRSDLCFQRYALFRHMNVFDNVAFGLRVKPRRRRPRKARFAGGCARTARTGTTGLAGGTLSAPAIRGDAPAVALARALAHRAARAAARRPFGALDAKGAQGRTAALAAPVARPVAYLQRDHDQEALEVSDRVVLMNQGTGRTGGDAEQVYEQPNAIRVRFSRRGQSVSRPDRRPAPQVGVENLSLGQHEFRARRRGRWVRPAARAGNRHRSGARLGS